MLRDRLNRHRELIGFSIVVIAYFTVLGMALPLVPLLATDLGASPGMLGILFSVATCGALFGAIPAGQMVTRLGSRTMIFFSVLLSGASCFFLFAAPTMTSLFIWYSLFELGRSVFIVSSQTHAGGLPTTGDVSVNFGRYGVAAAVGQLLGPFAAGILMDTAGFHLTWLVMGVLCALICAAVYRLIGPGLQVPARRRSQRPRTGGVKQHGDVRRQGAGKQHGNRQPSLRRFFSFYAVLGLVASVIIVFTVGMRRVFYPIYVEQLGYTASAIGLMLSIRALTSVLARLFLMPATRLLGGRLSTLVICMFALAIGLGTIPFCRNLTTLGLNSVLIGLGVGLAMPMSQATVFESVESSERGLALGVRLTGNRLAQLTNPVLFGLLTECFGISVAFWAGGAILCLVALPVLIMLARRNNR